jgi:hypothetical protein
LGQSFGKLWQRKGLDLQLLYLLLLLLQLHLRMALQHPHTPRPQTLLVESENLGKQTRIVLTESAKNEMKKYQDDCNKAEEGVAVPAAAVMACHSRHQACHPQACLLPQATQNTDMN